MIYLILIAFYLTLPAYVANMAPVIFAKLGLLKFLNKPVDGGKKWGKEFVFGSGKTWRGIVSAAIVGLLIAWLQAYLYQYQIFSDISLIDYPKWFLLFGPLAGLGAILGDLMKSFFKRRVGIKSGMAWPVFDQLDFIIGFFVFTYWFAWPLPEVVITVMLLTLVLHPLTNITSYLLGIKKVWW